MGRWWDYLYIAFRILLLAGLLTVIFIFGGFFLSLLLSLL